MFTLQLSDNYLILVDEGGPLDTQVYVSGAGAGGHSGTVNLSGAQMVWICHKDGVTSIEVDRPQESSPHYSIVNFCLNLSHTRFGSKFTKYC